MAYIKQCLDSILNQTFQDFKIIIVDDMSSDMSYAFAKMYERRYPDKIIVKQASSKIYAGGCRNIGIDYPIECEYYYFIDSDDYLYSNTSLKQIEDSLLTKPDVLLLGYAHDVNGKIIVPQYIRHKFNEKSTSLARTPWNAPWAKVIKSTSIEYFLENCMRAEDTYQFLKILDKFPMIKQIFDIIYIYRRTATSAIQSAEFKKHRPIYKQAMLDFKEICKNPYVRQSIINRFK